VSMSRPPSAFSRPVGVRLSPYELGGEEYIIERYREEVRRRKSAERAQTGETEAEQERARVATLARQAEALAASWRRIGSSYER